MRLEDALPALRAGRQVTLYGEPPTDITLAEILSDGWEIEPQPMTWLEACEAMVLGKKVRRQSWLCNGDLLGAPLERVPPVWREATDWVVVE